MTIKRNNQLFLILLLVFSFGAMVLASILPRWGLAELIPYLVCLIVGVNMLKKDGTPFMEALPYNVGIKPLTALYTVLLVETLVPLSTLLSEIGASLGGDALSLFQNELLGGPRSFMESLFEVAVIPAVFEEMFFRGFFYDGFKRAGSTRRAILLSSVLFGFFHMNLQQIAYAVVLGVVLALLREMTGSMWTGMLFHFVNNGWSTVLMSVPEDSALLRLPIERVTFSGTSSETVYAVVMLVLCTAVSVLLLFLIAKNEGKTEELKKFFPLREGEVKQNIRTGAFTAGCVFLLIGTVLFTITLLLAENPVFAEMLSRFTQPG